jgi:hypothetical protein
MNRNAFLAIAAIALSGCSTSRPQSSCQPMVAEICARAAEDQLHDGTQMVSSRSEEAQVVVFVVPVLRPGYTLATEVDCYVNTDSHTYSIVRSDLAIPPESQESVDFLKGRHLCAADGAYAEDERARVETAISASLASR